MSLSLRLAAAFVGLVAAVAVVFAAVGFVSAESGIAGQLDQFLVERAEELVDGDRDRPQRNGSDDEGIAVTDIDIDADNDNDGRRDRKSNSFDADSVVQTIAPDGTPLATTGMTLPIDDFDIALAASLTDDSRLRSIIVDGALGRTTART